MNRTALITGITGQDGSYLAEFLLDKGYAVHGLVRSAASADNVKRVLLVRAPAVAPALHQCDLATGNGLDEILDAARPDEIYHLAAQTNVTKSFEQPVETANVTGLGTLRMLEAAKRHQDRAKQPVRFFNASSSALYGKAVETPQTERTPFEPKNPYGCAKLFAHWETVNYRDGHGLFACNGILFNHESPRRPESFVTRKITRAAARIKAGLQQSLSLGDLDAHRDWGFAGDYVEAMWLALQHESPDDYVIATGKSHTVRDFVEAAFASLDLDWTKFVESDAALRRPSDADLLCGNAAKARQVLGWQPRVSFQELVRMMTSHDLELARKEQNSMS